MSGTADPRHPDQIRALEYIARKGTNATTATLRAQLREAFAAIEQAFDAVDRQERGRAPAPGKWSAHEILDHLVMSHGPAVGQLESLLSGVSPEGVAIPADLYREERPGWSELREQLRGIHQMLLARVDGANDELSLDPKAIVELVVKVDGEPRHWYEWLDWKAFVQAIRVHTLEHHRQLQRTVSG